MRAPRVVIAGSAVFVLLLAGCGLGGGTTGTAKSTTTKKGATTVFATVPIPATTLPPTTQPANALPSGPSQLPGSTVVGAIPKPTDRYLVKQGDLLDKIATAMGVTLQQLLDANGLTVADATRIQVGTPLRVPDGGRMPPGGTDASGAPAGNPGGVVPTTIGPGGPISAYYTVISGDTWIGIGSKLGVNVNQLLVANKANDATYIIPGQKLAIPGKTQAQVNAASTAKAPTTTIKATTTTKKV